MRLASLLPYVSLALSIAAVSAAQPVASSLQPAPATISLPPELISELQKVPDPGSPTMRLRVLKMNIESGSQIAPSEWHYERPEGGMVGVTWILPGKGGKGILRQMLTMHGLIELVAVVDMDFDYKTPIVVPLGKVFAPFGINSSFQANGVRNTKSLKGDLAVIGAISADAKFSYVHTFETRMTTTGTLGGTRSSSYEFSISCTAAQPGSAERLHPKLRGEYFPIACNGTNNQRQTLRYEHAYLIESKVYVPISATIDGRRDSYKITDVEYSE